MSKAKASKPGRSKPTRQSKAKLKSKIPLPSQSPSQATPKSLPSSPAPIRALTLDDLAQLEPIGEFAKSIDVLQTQGIKSLSDIRRQGGIQVKDQALPETAAKKIEAHAYLELVSPDVKTNQKLIDAGFYSQADIARTNRIFFQQKALAAGLEEKQAAIIYSQALAQMAAVSNLYTALKVEKANGFQAGNEPLVKSLGLDETCECRECESAVSPLAYLSDLLDYTLCHVQQQAGQQLQPLDLATLENGLCQPFSRLKAACSEVTNQVRQVRIAIEILRRYYQTHPALPANTLAMQERKYLFSAYMNMLEKLGTSYEEIREANVFPQDKRKDLAQRLGIYLSPGRPDELDELLLLGNTITGQELETLFGFADTAYPDAKTGSGSTLPGATEWKEYRSDSGQRIGIYVDVDTRAAGFIATPFYFASLAGASSHWSTTGANSIYNATPTGFRIYVRSFNGVALTPAVANQKKWHITWFGIESSGQAGTTPAGQTNWQAYQGGTTGIYIDVDTSTAKFAHTPVYLVSLAGDSYHWETTGAASVYHATPTGFRIYVRFWNGRELTPAFANQKKWRIQWIGILPGAKAGRTPAGATAWQAYQGGTAGIYADVDTSQAGFIATPDYLVSLGGVSSHWATTGATSVYQATPTGFCIYLRFCDGRELTPAFANQNQWHILWSVPDPGSFGFLRWRRKQLRRLWRMQDWPDTEYNQGSHPVLDPDLVTLLDLRNPFPGQEVYEFWKTRREWIDQRLLALRGDASQPANLEAMCQSMYAPVEYLGASLIPWKNTLPEAFNGLHESLTQGSDAEVLTAKNRIQEDLNLSVPAFSRLWEILDQYRKAQADPNLPTLSAADAWEACSILAQVQKSIFYPAWCTEEQTWQMQRNSILFSAQYFWKSAQDPDAGAWSPELHSQRPLLDPEITAEKDLLPPPLGQKAFSLWHVRKQALLAQRAAIQTAYAQDGLESSLLQVYGPASQFPLPGNQTWLEILAQLEQMQNSFDPQVQEQAQNLVQNHLHLSFEDFQHVLLMKNKAAEADQAPSASELDTLFVLLTSAYKRQTWLGSWAQAEEAQGLVYWRVLKPSLPAWRADLVSRQTWQQLLAKSSQVPAIDPDLVREEDLTTPAPGEKAYTLLQARKTWVEQQLAHMVDLRQNQAYQGWGGRGSGNGKFSTPSRAVSDSLGNVYVADRDNHLIQKFDGQGVFLLQWGGYPGSNPGDLKHPVDLAADAAGFVYVVDKDNYRIQKFDSQGVFIKTWGQAGSGDGQFQSPHGIAVDALGCLYVTDLVDHRVQKFDGEGNFIKSWGGFGTQPGQFNGPVGVFADTSSRIYVADTNNHRIQIFDDEGNFQSSLSKSAGEAGAFSSPIGVMADADGNILLTDSQARVINGYDAQGNFLGIWGQDRFANPRGLASTPQGNLLVADVTLHTITRVDTLSGLSIVCETLLGFGGNDLRRLFQEYAAGQDISCSLEQLNLDMNAFLRIMRLASLLLCNLQLLIEEWEELYAILLKVLKRRTYTLWRAQERSLDLILCQDHFLSTKAHTVDFSHWRVVWEERQDWQDKISSRLDQEQATVTGTLAAVAAAEEAVITRLRDILLAAVQAEGVDAASKIQWLASRLLVDFYYIATQKTTRVAQALVTLQNLLFSLRTGQLRIPEWQAAFDDSFDEEWKWLGSYEAWKAAMGVFLYPDNILLPSLRSEQSSFFREWNNKLRAYNYRFSSQALNRLLSEYETYAKDVCNLTLEAAVQYNQNTPAGAQTWIYVVGQGKYSNTVYMSAYQPQPDSSVNQTAWDKIPHLESAAVTQILGTAVYATPAGQHQLYLFLKVRETDASQLSYNHKLYCLKYDLHNNLWESEPTQLDLPDKTHDFTAVIQKGENQNTLPYLAMTVFCRDWTPRLYARKIAPAGWYQADKEWSDFLYEEHAESGLCGLVNAGSGKFVLFKQNSHNIWYGSVQFRLFIESEGANQSSAWITLADSQDVRDEKPWRGMIIHPLSAGKDVYILRSYQDIHYYQTLRIREGIYGYSGQHENFNYPLEKAIQACPSLADDASQSYRAVIFSQKKDLPTPLSVFQHYRAVYMFNFSLLAFADERHIAPAIHTNFLNLSPAYKQPNRKAQMETIFYHYTLNGIPEQPVWFHLAEIFYFVPLALSLQLQQAREYILALEWFRTMYDYQRPLPLRKIYFGLQYEETLEQNYFRPQDWLLDPLNPHAIAGLRQNTYTRFTLLMLIRCLIDYGDSLYTYDTLESLEQARTLYVTALGLLDLEMLNQHAPGCEDIIGYLDTALAQTFSAAVRQQLKDELALIQNKALLEKTCEALRGLAAQTVEKEERILQAKRIVATARQGQSRPSIAGALSLRQQAAGVWLKQFLQNAAVDQHIRSLQLSNEINLSTATSSAGASLRFLTAHAGFCIPKNPMIQVLRFWAENNLFKLRTGRNIAGIQRELEPYSASLDVQSAMPSITAGGGLAVATRIIPPPLPYRYDFLIERAKQLQNIAVQTEAAFLQALEKQDAEAYNLLRAKQDLSLARAGVKLQALRLTQAQDEVTLAELQKESAEIQVNTYQQWLSAGLTVWEQNMLNCYGSIARLQTFLSMLDYFLTSSQAMLTASTASFGAGAAFANAAIVTGVGFGKMVLESQLAGTQARLNIAALYADYERRAQEWELNQALAKQSVAIGEQSITLAQDGVKIVRQEQNIAQLQADNAQDILGFLNGKFTNRELYEWMGRILEGVYAYFLQQATAMAKLAQNQLAFERQEQAPAYIQNDYWESPSENALTGDMAAETTDRRGLTGSSRLLQDIYKLDQYRVETEKKKQQLVKTFSLAQLAPFEFQQFKETGVMVFNTSMEYFNRDFPGHYLRMLKRVRTTVAALIPPTQGIKATLSAIGTSRLVANRNGLFQTITAFRQPESVALSSPINATGLFELESQSNMLLPFEGMGVDTIWELRLPKTSNFFDYSTLADVFLTFEYTALDSPEYRQQVLASLPSRLSGERPFSFRHQFADQWYALHNPDQSATPMQVDFSIGREDFPPNLESIALQQVLLYFAGKKNGWVEIPITLTCQPLDGQIALGGEAATVAGLISTRQGNAGAWSLLIGENPAGTWHLTLPNTQVVKNWFSQGQIEDLLLVLAFSGRISQQAIS
ncbi:hypothetical protein JW933_08950 [candidate division FCPU426 bacterium]|nr:hypothetical protein [candidate division FCPU426 bacterium]